MTAQCDAWFSSLYKYSYLLAYQRRRDFAIAVNSDCTTGFSIQTVWKGAVPYVERKDMRWTCENN